MRSLVLLVSALLSITSASEDVFALTSSQRQLLLATHNKARKEVDPVAKTPLPTMTYDSTLEKEAMEALKNEAGCKDLKSNRKNGNNYYTFDLRSSTAGDMMFRHAIANWAQQKSKWRYDVGCIRQERCREYKQMIWATSTKVGCGLKRCMDGNWGHYKVQCKYEKPGQPVDTYPRIHPYFASVNEGKECWSYGHCRDGPCWVCGPGGLCCQKDSNKNGCKNQGGLRNHRCVGIAASSPTKTCGGTANGAVCKFPFDYKGVRYQACTTHDNARPWCYTANGWGHCDCSAAEVEVESQATTLASSLVQLAKLLNEMSEFE